MWTRYITLLLPALALAGCDRSTDPEEPTEANTSRHWR